MDDARMDNARQQIVDSIKNKSNILVTVSTDPSVDGLSAALGLSILLNNLDKRATSVFSGAIPPAINFLEPDKTFESSAESLRDFIIALDKEKADHLRYKVEGDVVKIFITPYKTMLSQDDLEFSEGDYNVELVIALGVKDQNHLDKALAAHGKILHDATVVTITAGPEASNLGNVDWNDVEASSLSEMIVSLADGLKADKPLLDEQTSTALLTGIVSATDRFSNNLTSSRVMTMAAQLMAAGANQQLIAAKLEEAHDIPPGRVAASGLGPSGEAQGVKSDTELTIDRPDRRPNVKPQPPKKTVVEPSQNQNPAGEPVSSDSTELINQLELEKQLAGLTVPRSGTMEDIENELRQAAAEPEAPEAPEVSLTTPSDATMPGFEPTDMPTPASASPAVEPPVLMPKIENEHTLLDTTTSTQSPINSIQNDPNDGEATVDPFGTQSTPLDAFPAMPSSNVGTPQGAAILASEPDPVAPPVQTTPVVGLPELPPLPPLPPDINLPPLPPPPPPPTFAQPSGVMPSGAISADKLGDIFGNTPPDSSPVPALPAEPGQFKIPGTPS